MKKFYFLCLTLFYCLSGVAQDDENLFKVEVTGGVGFYKFNNTSHDLSNWGINGLNDVQFANNRPRFNFDLGVSYKRFGLKFNFFQWGDTCLEPYNSNHFFNNLSLDLLFFPISVHLNN